MLHLSAEDDEWISINSPDFGITAGRSYRLTVEGSIPEASSGSAYATVIFLRDGTETARHLLPLAPAPIEVDPVSTDRRGRFEVGARALDPGRYRLEVSVEGDLVHWPARAERRVVVR